MAHLDDAREDPVSRPGRGANEASAIDTAMEEFEIDQAHGLFPFLLWLTARCRVFSPRQAATLVSITVDPTTVFGVGQFGDPRRPIDDCILQAQCTILFVALSTFILAALFAERKKSEARLIESKMMLERERDNKLMNVRAITASIAHEIVQADSDFGAGCRSFAIC